MQGRGLDGQLVSAASRRYMKPSQEVGGKAMMIDAKDEKVARWYASYGAVALIDAPHSMLLPYSLLIAAVRKAGKEEEARKAKWKVSCGQELRQCPS